MTRKTIEALFDRENLKSINDNFEELYSEIVEPIEKIALRLWEEIKENNQISIKDSVQNFSDLPSNDDKHTLRVVLSEQKVYQFNGEEWKVFSEIEIDPYKSIKKELEDLVVEVQNVARANFNLDSNSSIPPKITSSGNNFKLVDKVSADEMYVYQVAGNNYLRYFFKKNNGGSGYGETYELLRSQKVEPISNIVVYKEVKKPTTGTVTSLWNYTGTNSVERRVMPYKIYDQAKRYSNNGNTPIQSYQINAGQSVSYTMQATPSKKMNVAFYARGGFTSSEDFAIKIDGEVLQELNIKNAPMQYTRIFEFITPPTDVTYTLTIENKSANGLYLTAINLFTLHEYKEQEVDSYVAYGQLGKTPFIDNQGANDYALKNLENNQLFGSYHGGETVESCKMEYVDNADLIKGVSLKNFSDIPVNKFYLSKNLSIRQESTLIQRANTYSVADFNTNGTLNFNFSYNILEGATPIPIKDLWIGLTCTHSSFSKVKIPKRIDFGNTYTGETIFFPSTIGLCVQTTSDETQEIHIRHSRFKNSFVATEHPQSVTDLEIYRKYYYAPIRSNTNTLVAPVTFQFTKALDFYTI
ncbi:hypothetical protein ACFV8V_13570 [Mammaliicoccus sciuri]|uniref:hypothetical protein n=1 Tax=Mammaliicoccus sciuri TaxID=1296 RepID=UPI00364A367E